jgi:hypothetical protein
MMQVSATAVRLVPTVNKADGKYLRMRTRGLWVAWFAVMLGISRAHLNDRNSVSRFSYYDVDIEEFFNYLNICLCVQ